MSTALRVLRQDCAQNVVDDDDDYCSSVSFHFAIIKGALDNILEFS